MYRAPAIFHDEGIPLYRAFPRLQQVLPRKALCALPTPIDRLDELGSLLGIQRLYCKRDDLSGGFDAQGNPLYGGNKVRKLEFLFGEALALGTDQAATFGCAGSNHAVATAYWSKKLDTRVAGCILFLIPQPPSYGVRYNLMLDKGVGACIEAFKARKERAERVVQWCVQQRACYGRLLYCIP